MKKIILISFLIIFLVSCEKEVFDGILNPTTFTEFGKFYITSNPLGYKLYIDDKYWGVSTPDTVSWLATGTHKLSLKHELFSDSSLSVDIKKESTPSLFIDMISNPRFYSNIICSSIPSGASIYLNDQPTGKVTTSVINKVYPGYIEIKYVLSGCRDDSIIAKVKGGTYTEINRILNDTTRGVDYRTINSRIFSNELSKVVIDKYNNKWIGTIADGLIKFDGKNWFSYKNSGILKSNIVTALLIDSKDRLWVGSAEGLTVYNGGSWQSYDDKLPSPTITAIEEDPSGNIWIGTLGGLVKYNNSSFQIYNSGNSGLPENIITCVTFAKNGDLWVGTSQFGVVEFTNKMWINHQTVITSYDKRISRYISDLTFDNNGLLWVFHMGSITLGRSAFMRYNNDEWLEFKLPLLFQVNVLSFNVDSDNNIWMATREGLVKYNESKPIKWFNNYEYGFYVTECTSSALDKNGDMWVTTLGGGIVKLKKNSF